MSTYEWLESSLVYKQKIVWDQDIEIKCRDYLIEGIIRKSVEKCNWENIKLEECPTCNQPEYDQRCRVRQSKKWILWGITKKIEGLHRNQNLKPD